MNGVNVQNANGETININVIRYFKLNGFDYLVFSLNEIDDGGYVKLYISKIVDGIGMSITDDVEWNLIKDTIKDVIKRNKEGISLGIEDLSENNISQIKINDQKVFKLNDSLLQLLSANKNVKENVLNNEPTLDKDIFSENNETLDQKLAQVNTSDVSEVTPVTQGEGNFTNNVPEQPLMPDINNVSDTVAQDNNIVNDNYLNQDATKGVNIELNTNFTNSVSPEQENLNSDLYYNGDDDKNGNNLAKNENITDYKALYEDEKRKNEEISNELKKYQNLINSLKEVLK